MKVEYMNVEYINVQYVLKCNISIHIAHMYIYVSVFI